MGRNVGIGIYKSPNIWDIIEKGIGQGPKSMQERNRNCGRTVLPVLSLAYAVPRSAARGPGAVKHEMKRGRAGLPSPDKHPFVRN